MDTDPAVRDRTLKLPVFQLVYISAPKEDWTGEALKNLLEQCRDRNRGLGISGLLLYRPGMFMQVLEGDEADVRRVYADIESDSRHQDVTLISSGRVPLRRFENWSMAFRDLRDPTLIGKQGFSEFLNMPMVAIPFLLQPSRLEVLLLAFRANLNEGVCAMPLPSGRGAGPAHARLLARLRAAAERMAGRAGVSDHPRILLHVISTTMTSP